MHDVIQNHPPTRKQMTLHCGAEDVSRSDVFNTATPRATQTWYPLPHRDLIMEVEGQLTGAGFTISGESHALSHHGNRYFGVFGLNLPDKKSDHYSWVVGIRNSHDKTCPAGLVAGTRVFVCDNLAFTGEVRISRKHTRYAERDLKHLTARAVGQLGDRFMALDQRVDAYRNTHIRDRRAHDIIVRAIDCRAITPTQVPGVLDEWRQPSHEEFLPRTAWSLFNAFTEQMKGTNPQLTVNRSQALHGLFDGVVGLSN